MSARPDPEPVERLLDRPAPEEYLDEWAKRLAAPPATGDRALRPAVVFRLGEERFALDAGVVREFHVPRRVCRLPGRTNAIFRGLVVLRGEVHLAADLHALLGCEHPGGASTAQARMVVLERGAERWAFEADEVLDVLRYAEGSVASPQVTVAKALVHFSDGVLALEGGPAARLDPERCFAGLARSLT